MSNGLPLRRWLGTSGRDPGCDAAFEVLDEYVEAVLRGDEGIGERFAELVTHAGNCDACREDTEGLIAAIREVAPPPTED
jgi:hypothetical protein